MFPCFDQPDLKAVFKLSIITNHQWVAATNAPEKRIMFIKQSGNLSQSDSIQSQIEDQISIDNSEAQAFITDNDLDWMLSHFMNLNIIKIYDFFPSEPLPTYLYTINCGPFKIYEHKNLQEGSPPQRVFQRPNSMKLDPRNVTVLVEKTIKFYESIFGVKFPFRKLDHVLCPDVRYAAMESAGCITYSEVSLTNKKASEMATSERIVFNMIV